VAALLIVSSRAVPVALEADFTGELQGRTQASQSSRTNQLDRSPIRLSLSEYKREFGVILSGKCVELDYLDVQSSKDNPARAHCGLT
jgi:hypothetical protein